MSNPNAIGQPFILTDHLKVRADIHDYFTEKLKRFEHLKVWDPDVGPNGKEVYKMIHTGFNMPGVAGVAAHIGTSRSTYFEYLKRVGGDNEEQHLIGLELMRARTIIEAAQENGLFDKEAHRGAMFSLGVNFNWGGTTVSGGGGGLVVTTIAPSEGVMAIAKWESEE